MVLVVDYVLPFNIFIVRMQLDLFSGAPVQEPIEFLSESEFQDMAQRADITDVVAVSNPCLDCCYKGLCDSDGCAAHLFDLDCDGPIDPCEDLFDFV